jgi:hypothetical protein
LGTIKIELHQEVQTVKNTRLKSLTFSLPGIHQSEPHCTTKRACYPYKRRHAYNFMSY